MHRSDWEGRRLNFFAYLLEILNTINFRNYIGLCDGRIYGLWEELWDWKREYDGKWVWELKDGWNGYGNGNWRT